MLFYCHSFMVKSLFYIWAHTLNISDGMSFNLHRKRIFGYRQIAVPLWFCYEQAKLTNFVFTENIDMKWSKTPQIPMTIISCFSFRFMHTVSDECSQSQHTHHAHTLTHTLIRIKLILSPCQNPADNKLHDHSHMYWNAVCITKLRDI